MYKGESEAEKIEKVRPISLRVENEIGAFSVEENESGAVKVEIISKEGQRILLNDMLPQGYEAIGNKRLWEDPEYAGLYNTDTSLADYRNKTIVVSEQELKRMEWKYILVFLHELGHTTRNEEHPEEHEEITTLLNEFYKSSGNEQAEILKRQELLISQSERNAWAFAILKFRNIMHELGLSGKDVFEDAAALKEFIYTESLRVKPEFAKQYVDELTISEEDRQKLVEEIYEMYIH